jgi:hypothetical protein
MVSYRKLVASNPVASQVVMTASLFWLGDVVAQKLIEQRRFDWHRSLRITSFGFVVAGPMLSTWYTFLNGQFTGQSALRQTVSRTFVDQFLFTPVFITTFFSVNGILDGKSSEQIQSKLNADFKSTLVANWKLWIPVQVLNFTFIPPDLRLLFVNSVATIWNSFLSFKNQSQT